MSSMPSSANTGRGRIGANGVVLDRTVGGAVGGGAAYVENSTAHRQSQSSSIHAGTSRLKHMFAEVVESHLIGVRKPHQAFYEQVLASGGPRSTASIFPPAWVRWRLDVMADAVMLFLLGKLAEAAGSRTAEMIARDLLGLQAAEVQLLTAVQESVDSLMAGPLNSGLMKLDAALAAHRPRKERRRLLKEARSSFMDALGQETRPLNRSLAHFNLAVVWYLLDSPRDVPANLRHAHVEAAKGGIIVPGSNERRSRFSSSPPSPKLDQGRLDYVNHIAFARRSWGSCSVGAPYFSVNVVGPVFFVPESGRSPFPPAQLAQAEQRQAREGLPASHIPRFLKNSSPCQVLPQTFRCATHPYGVVEAAPTQ
ncbi:hypothetical protein [Nonomuraea sp. KM90]|uniref:hypothetical protein n=1 Tax=Nonomuraea sp. KM90 TaxID=3457428 RepID=UPI003FCE4026